MRFINWLSSVLRPITHSVPRTSVLDKPACILHLPSGKRDWDQAGYTLGLRLKVRNKDKGAVTVPRSAIWATLWSHSDSRQSLRLSGDPLLFDVRGIGPGSSGPEVLPIVFQPKETKVVTVTLQSAPLLRQAEAIFPTPDAAPPCRIECQIDIGLEVSPRPGREVFDPTTLHRTRSLRCKLSSDDVQVKQGTWKTAKAAMISEADIRWLDGGRDRERLVSDDDDRELDENPAHQATRAPARSAMGT